MKENIRIFFAQVMFLLFSFNTYGAVVSHDDDYVVLTHVCGVSGGSIEVIEEHMPPHKRYYWKDTGVGGDRAGLSPGVYELAIVTLSGCEEIMPYRVYDVTEGVEIGYEISDINDCCYRKVTVYAEKGGERLSSGSYHVHWSDAPDVSSSHRVLAVYRGEEIRIGLELNGGCYEVRKTIAVSDGYCEGTGAADPRLLSEEVPSIILKDVTFAGGQHISSGADMDFLRIKVTGVAGGCSQAIDIRGRSLVLMQREIPEGSGLRPITRVVKFKDHPVFRRVRQGSELILYMQRPAHKADGIALRTGAYDYQFVLSDSMYFDLLEVDTEVFVEKGAGGVSESAEFVYYTDREGDNILESTQESGKVERKRVLNPSGRVVEMFRYVSYSEGDGSGLPGNVLYKSSDFTDGSRSGDNGLSDLDRYLRDCTCLQEDIINSSHGVDVTIHTDNHFRIYPNPSNTSFIDLDIHSSTQGGFHLKMYSVEGVVLKAERWQGVQGNSLNRLYLEGLVAGMYICQLQFPDGDVQVLKLVIL